LYADKVTESMRKAIEETARRREAQQQYNEQHGITPTSIKKNIHAGIESEAAARRVASEAVGRDGQQDYVTQEYIGELQAEMLAAAESLEFERAATIRDRLAELEEGNNKTQKKTRRGTNQRRGRVKGRRVAASRVPKPKRQ
jgi:excinuclease ABC subunit B